MPVTPRPPSGPPVASCPPAKPLPVPAGACPRATEAQIDVAQRLLAPVLPKRLAATAEGTSVEASVTPTYHFGCYFKGSPWFVGAAWTFYSRSEGDTYGADVWRLEAGKRPSRVLDPAAPLFDETALYGDGTEDALDEDAPTYDFDGDGLADTFLELAPQRREWAQARTFQVYFGGGTRSVSFTRTLPYNTAVEPVVVAAPPAHAAFGFFPAGFGLGTERSRRWARSEALAVDVASGVAIDAPEVIASLWGATDGERQCHRDATATADVQRKLRGEEQRAADGEVPLAPALTCVEPSAAEASAIRQQVVAYATSLLRERGGSFDSPIELTYGCKTHDEILFVISQGSSEGFGEVWHLSREGKIEALEKSYFRTSDNGYLRLQGYADVDGDGTLEAWLTRSELRGTFREVPLTALFVRGDFRSPAPRGAKPHGRPATVAFTRVAEALDFVRFRSGSRDFFVGADRESVTEALRETPEALEVFGVGAAASALSKAKADLAAAAKR